MPLFDFICVEGHQEEKLLKEPVDASTCSICGLATYRQLSAPTVKLEAVSGSFPGATMRFERIHREAGRKGDNYPLPIDK